jgi:hypothetical protein
MPRLLREAGLVDVQARPMVQVFPPGHPRRTITLDFMANLASRLLAQGLTAELELADLTASLRRHVDDPGTLLMSHLFVQAWGESPRDPGRVSRVRAPRPRSGPCPRSSPPPAPATLLPTGTTSTRAWPPHNTDHRVLLAA